MGTLKLRYGDFGIDIEPIPGLADSGSLQHDLIALFRCVGEAAAEQSNAVLLLIDEIQCLPGKDLRALIMMAHEMQQERLPVAIVVAYPIQSARTSVEYVSEVRAHFMSSRKQQRGL